MPEPVTAAKSPQLQRSPAVAAGIGRSTPAPSASASALTTAGNLAIQRFGAPRLQRKPRVSIKGDIYEDEADRVSLQVLSFLSAPTVQRKCACGGEGECDECKRKAAAQSVAVKRKTDDLSVQRFSVEENAPGPVGNTSTADSAGTGGPAAAPGPTPGLIVEDTTTDLGTGQIKKSEFLGQLRGPVTAAAQAGLQGTMWATLGSAAIDPWFQSYSRQSAQQLERSIQSTVPGSAGITNAGAYIPLVGAQVQRAVGEWARTGKVPSGVPAGLPGMDLPGTGILSSIGGAVSSLVQGAKNVVSGIGSGISSLAQSAGNALSSIAGVLFKPKEGGARAAADLPNNDPRAIQAQLGSGDALEGNLQSRMSSAFGCDFSSVRVHKGNQAAQLSADLSARAFTIGSNVAFGAGEYQPGSPIGDALIAHELAHVVQQGGATMQGPLQKGEAETGSLEEDADVSAVRAVTSIWSGAKSGLARIGRNAIPALKSGLKLQRCNDKPELGVVVQLPKMVDVVKSSTVEGAREADWQSSVKDYQERGGWIIWQGSPRDARTGVRDDTRGSYFTKSWPVLTGAQDDDPTSDPRDQIESGPPPANTSLDFLVGHYHDHPPLDPSQHRNPSDFPVGPSPKDDEAADHLGLPGVVKDFTDVGRTTVHDYLYGPAAPRLQRKPRVGASGDLDEAEADRVSQHVLSLISAPTVQRKCACGGEGECDECKRKTTAHRVAVQRTTEDLYVQRAPDGDPAAGTSTPAAAPAAAPTATPGLIVEDTTTDLSTGQMKKSDFLGQLRGPVTAAAQSGLLGTMWATLGSIAIDPWFQYYSRQSASQLERSVQSSVPGSAGITNAGAYIPLVSAQVQRAVGEWARTGKVPPGVPTGLPGMDLPGTGILSSIGGAVSGLVQGVQGVISDVGSGISNLTQSAGNALSSIAGVLFKAKEGGARIADDPRAIQTQLGSGDVLEGSLQSRMSSAFGYDFSSVRVHKDNQAAQLSANLNARAFTVGRNVAFGAGEYQPGSPIGDALIAHELAHVVQQGGATVQGPLQKGESETGVLEQDADLSAVHAVTSIWSGAKTGLSNIAQNAVPALKSGLKLQRCGGKPSPPPPVPVPPTFDQYRDRFNALWNAAPFNAMPAADAGFDPALDSRGPRTRKARAIFAKILTDDPTMQTAYTANTGGIRDHIDTYVGPEGLNLITSPRLEALKSAFAGYPSPVPAASYPAFRSAVAAAAGALTTADRDAVEKSNDWQRRINDSVTTEANRAEIRALISPPPSAGSTTGPTPAQRAHFLAAWYPAMQYWDGQRSTWWAPPQTVRYHVGAQNFRVNAFLPPSETNPGLSLYVSAQILRGATPLFAPPPQTEFPPGQNSSPLIAMPILAPATVSPAGDPLTFRVSMLEPGAAGVMTALGTKSLHTSVRREAAFTQAQAEHAAAVDEVYLHNAAPTGLLGKMTARGGVAANVAEAITTGKITLHALTSRHDSAAFVVAHTGAANPNQEGYFMGPSYATGSFTAVVGAAGFTLSSGEILINRTPDVPSSSKRSDDEVILFVVHESMHRLDVRPGAGTPIEKYKTEFRAYWMDGRYGPPDSPTCGGVVGRCYGTTYDPGMAPPGPKSPRARVIFDGLYGSATYPFVKPAYDDNTLGFRQQVDNYLIPDGINLAASVRLENLRSLIAAGPGADFPAFRVKVQAFMGVGPAPAGGVLNAADRAEISHNRAWRDLVESNVTNPTQQGQIKSDLGIPV